MYMDDRYFKMQKLPYQCSRDPFQNFKKFWTDIWNYILVIKQQMQMVKTGQFTTKC